MHTKSRIKKTSLLVTLLLFFLCTQQLSAANVLGRPRKMFLIKTEHFDIIYSNQSQESALLLVQNAEELYSRALDSLESFGALEVYDTSALKINLHMPVIISPDSDVLSVNYTSSPYNRIIIFDSPASEEQAVFEDTMLSLFYCEIYKALAQSIRSPFNQFVAKWVAGDIYQPVTLFNLPYSFTEGIAYFEESEENCFRDSYYLPLLAQAKLEGKFPDWTQVTTVRDTYPGEELALAAGEGFSAYLMNAYGVEKYAELWKESGKLNPLLTQGVFYQTYGKRLKELWAEFEEAVPLPEGLTGFESYALEGERLFPSDVEANYEHLLLTGYGTVWYDRIRHEVDIYDEKSILKIRQLLFLADNIERMSLSPDGRYIAVSHTQARTMEGLSSSSTWIYDLKNRRFLDAKYELKDASIIFTEEGAYAVAGVNVKDVHARLEVYTMPLGDKRGENISLLYSREFERNKTPLSPVYAGQGAVLFILAEGQERCLCKLKLDGTEEKGWFISSSESPSPAGPLRIKWLSYNSSSDLYTFDFVQPEQNSFTRAGFIKMNESYEPQSIQLTCSDVSGGINYPAVSSNGILFYSAKKYSVNQLRSVELSEIPLEEGLIQKIPEREENEDPLQESENKFSAGLEAYNVRRYYPFKYMADLSFTPFFPIKILDFSEGNLYWPGLGLTIESQTDPCMNTQAVLSAGWTYLPMDFSWTNNIPSSYLAKIRTEANNINKDKSAAFFIENSSTPVNIEAGTIFNCNLEGEYNFKVLAGGQWKLPVGIALRHLIFNLQASYNVSTDYYDQTQSNIRPSLSDWPSFSEAYEMYELSAKIEYSNIHQYGYSTFEQRGISLGMRAYSMWDMCEVKLLREARKEQEEKSSQTKTPGEGGSETDSKTDEQKLTNAQKKNLFSEQLADITQLNAGFFTTIAIPRLNPLTMKNNWVLSMPAVLTAEFVNKAGTALESSFQVLLIGCEIHHSVIPAFLYSRRAGLWFGYDMALVYDTAEVRLPDIRRKNYLAEVFTDISYTHAFYMVLNLDLNITTGKLARVPINTTLTGTYYPESRGYGISLDVRLHL